MLCPICKGPPNDEMVQCDKCNRWCHHVCVGLTEEIARSLPSWYCNGCRQDVPPSRSFLIDSIVLHEMGASSTMVKSPDQTAFINENTLIPTNHDYGNGGFDARVAPISSKTSQNQGHLQLQNEIEQITAKLNQISSADNMKSRQTNRALHSGQNKPVIKTNHHDNSRMNLLAEKERLI